MHSLRSWHSARVSRILMVIAAFMAAFVPWAPPPCAAAEDIDEAIQKANLYIEVARMTERARDSWERYASWVNMKAGPTGKERYISYGMYEVYDVSGPLTEARGAARLKPDTPALDAVMASYIEAYDAVAPVLNEANQYYERKAYEADGMAEGKALHARMVPLADAFLAKREAMLQELRPFMREVEGREVAAIEAKEGRSRTWHAANVLHAANRVIDTFPKTRPKQIDSDTLDEMMQSLGPNSSGEEFDQIIAGVVPPQGVVIDMTRFDPAMDNFAEAVETFDQFAAQKPEELEDLKDKPQALLAALRELQKPLQQNQGKDFEGSGPLVNQVVQAYFDMLNDGNSLAQSQLRFLE
ncbi:DUF3829 domain-containing protein [Hyphomicrobium sp.]|uniref:DUF3829 domain-containing protein n=1 Tax=Hyphomicrobium sp. TaxID=82 RepID=UPI003F70C936